MDRAEMVSAGRGSVALRTGPRPTGESHNQDACAILPYADGHAALAVCDGAGGMRSGGEAARLTVEALRGALRRSGDAGRPLRAAILDGIEEASRSVRKLGGAATLAVAEVDGEGARPYHVGDAAILLVGGRGRVKYQSLPHGPVGYALEAGVLSETEAMHHEERHLVSNVIGAADMRIEVGPRLRMAPRDTLLLASDGLSDNLYLEEIVAALRTGALEEVIERLVSDSHRRMTEPRTGEPSKEDDLTVLLYRRDAPHRRR